MSAIITGKVKHNSLILSMIGSVVCLFFSCILLLKNKRDRDFTQFCFLQSINKFMNQQIKSGKMWKRKIGY